MNIKLRSRHIKYVSTEEEVENMIKHKEKAIDKLGKRKYNRLLEILRGSYPKQYVYVNNKGILTIYPVCIKNLEYFEYLGEL